MRPIKLMMTAFGPYAGEEIVDFREAVASGLFGIYGSTGSGKSTIFSAITFALFGEASRSDQDTASLRSHHAADDTPTQVDFIFEIGAARYLIRRRPDQIRPALRGGGTTNDTHKAWLFDITGIDPDDITEDNSGKIIAEKKVGHVKTAVQERLGYGAEQFRQIVLLPQGKFETFLTAKTDERMKILRELFDVSLYRKLAQTLKDQAKAAEDAVVIDRRTCARRLEHEGFESPDALKAGITAATDEHAKAVEMTNAAAKAATRAAKIKADADQLEATFLANEKAQADLRVLTGQKPGIDAAETKLKNARKAQSLLDVDQAQKTARLTRARAEADLTTAKTAHKAAVTQNATASQQLEAQEALADQRDDQRRSVEALARYTATLTQAQTLKNAWDTAQSKQAADKTTCDQAEARHKDIAGKHAAAEQQVKTAQARTLARSKLTAELTKAKQALAVARAHADANRLWTEAKDLVTKATADHTNTQNQLGAAQIRFDQAETHLSAAQAQHLADKLVDGEPCSVCGSESHPSPAQGDAESAGLDQAFREARGALETKRAAHAKAAQALAGANAKAEERKANLETLTKPEQTIQAAEKSVNDLSSDLNALGPDADIAEIEAEIARLAKQVTDAQSAITTARGAFETSKTATALAKQAYDTALGSIPEALRSETALATATQTKTSALKTMQEAFKAAQDNAKKAREAALSRAKDLESAEKALAGATSALQQAADTFANRLKQQAFSSEGFETHKAHIAQIDALTNEIDTYKNKLTIAQDRAKTSANAIKDKTRPDIEAMTQASHDADAARTREAAKAAALKAKSDQLETLLKSISDEMARIERVEQETAALRELAALFNANNAAKLDLETFAIGAMFDQVLQAANLRLQPMTSGRYSLEREFEGKGGGRRGLGICVHDIHTGQARATSTLSGGETFIAALSLALGLSDIVESVSGNIRLDTIFIDEGFGSLDTDNDTGTLDQVLQTLQDLVGNNRAVGLISHVELVQHAIPNGFAIKKTATGSHVETRGF